MTITIYKVVPYNAGIPAPAEAIYYTDVHTAHLQMISFLILHGRKSVVYTLTEQTSENGVSKPMMQGIDAKEIDTNKLLHAIKTVAGGSVLENCTSNVKW